MRKPGGQKTALWGSEKRIIVYAGQYYDAETMLHYNRFRYFNPSIGRYLRTDPIGLNGGINLYLYTSNNPNKYIDPMGQVSFTEANDYFHKGKKPKEFPDDWEPMSGYIIDPESPQSKCLNKVYEEMKKEMGITSAVQASCMLQGAAICAVVGGCTDAAGFGPCMGFVMKRCGVVANMPRIPIIAKWLKKRAKCLKLEGSIIKAN